MIERERGEREQANEREHRTKKANATCGNELFHTYIAHMFNDLFVPLCIYAFICDFKWLFFVDLKIPTQPTHLMQMIFLQQPMTYTIIIIGKHKLSHLCIYKTQQLHHVNRATIHLYFGIGRIIRMQTMHKYE